MMTTAENMIAQATTLAPVRMADGGRMVIRGIQRLFGASLAIAAIGLWLAPGANWESDVMLFKLILSLIALIAGVGLMQASVTPKTPEAEIDTIRREVRLIRTASDGSGTVLERCSFAMLTRAELRGSNVRLWGQNNTLLAEVTLTDRATLQNLTAGLRDAGKLD